MTLAAVIEHALDADEDAQFWREVDRTMASSGAVGVLTEESERAAGAGKDGLEPEESWDDLL